MDIAAERHRRRLASARAAMAGDRRHDGDRDPVGARRPGHRQGRARRGAAAHRADDARLGVSKLSPRTSRGGPGIRAAETDPGKALARRERRFAAALLAPAFLALAGDDDVPAAVPDLDQRVPDGPRDAVRGRLCGRRRIIASCWATTGSGRRCWSASSTPAPPWSCRSRSDWRWRCW